MAVRSNTRVAAHATPDRGLRDQLHAASALIGAPLTVTDDLLWEITPLGVRVGLGYFASRGHSDEEASALALLELWQHVRFPRVSPERTRRRTSILEQRPELEPLLDTVLRLQAAAELLTVMPASQEALATAAFRSLPSSFLEWPRHLQWVGTMLQAGLSRHVGQNDGAYVPTAVDPSVAAEWHALQRLAPSGSNPLRRVLAPDPSRSPLLRWERALALVLPAFDRLRSLDFAERGLDPATSATGPSDPDHDDALPEDAPTAGAGSDGSDTESADANQQAASSASSNSASRPPEAAEERARAGDGQDRAEGADLFAAEQAGFVQKILSTPMPTNGALLLDGFELPADARAATEDAGGERLTAPGQSGGATRQLEYQQRVSDLRPSIDRMRDVWARVIAERVALRRTRGRRAYDAGDTLHTESLSTAVAAAVAGVPRPHAFVQTQMRSRRTRRAGSTDYVLLVDRSASMQGPAAMAAGDAVLIMIEALAGVERDVRHTEVQHGIDLDLDIRTALIVFDSHALAVKPLSRGLDDRVRHTMLAEIGSPRGSTNDVVALREAARQLGIGRGSAGGLVSDADNDGLERRRIVIFIGDGGSNDPVSAAHELRRLHDAGVRVIGIGLGSDEIVQRFAPTSRRVDDPRLLPEVLHELIAEDLA